MLGQCCYNKGWLSVQDANNFKGMTSFKDLLYNTTHKLSKVTDLNT